MSENRPFFSVVVPVYNRAHLLSVSLSSVLAQSCQDFEIIVVDDGSRDDPAAAAAALGDARIRVIHQANAGGGAARNTGIDAARGAFIAFLDSDDHFLPHHLATMKRLLAGTRGMAGYARVLVDRGAGVGFQKPPRAIAPDEDMATYLLCDRGFVQTSTLVVPAELARHVRFPTHHPAAEDTDIAIRLYLEGARFVMAEEPGAVWNDGFDPGRLSAGRKGAEFLPWLESLKQRIPEKAYLGCLGWAYAKHVAGHDRARALRLYLNAVRHGCYRPGLAAIIFLQIFLSDRAYRFVADTAIARLRAGFRATDSSGQPTHA